MRFTLRVRMHNTEGVLERVLGRLRQRNYSVCSLAAEQHLHERANYSGERKINGVRSQANQQAL